MEGAWRFAAPTGQEAVLVPLPQPLPHLLSKLAAAVLQPIVTSKKPAAGQGPAQKTPKAQAASTDPTLTAPVPPAPELTPELTATAAAASDEAAIDPDSAMPLQPAAARSNATDESLEPATPTVTMATGPASQTQEMAFATRVQPVEHVDRSALPAEMASSANVASATKKVVAAAEEDTASPADAHTPLTPVVATLERSSGPNSTSAAAGPAAPAPTIASHHVEAPSALAESQAKGSTPIKNISLQVNQPGSERIDVRVVQQGGEVHVSVHTGDATMTTGLRQGLSDLQSRLEENGYRSEMWRPGAVTAPIAASAAGQASTNSSRGDQGQSQPQQQHGGSQQDGGRRNQNQSNRPGWVEEMESSLGSGQKSSGGFYGFGN